MGLKDEYCPSYFNEMRNLTLVNREYCIRNPKHYKGYGPDCWGLTASYSVDGYAAHGPLERDDRGVISPTAALSSIVYTPDQSLQVMRHLYQMGDKVFGPYGFYDAFSETADWYPKRYLAIDQGPILAGIANYRDEFVWNVMKKNPYIRKGLERAGFAGGWLLPEGEEWQPLQKDDKAAAARAVGIAESRAAAAQEQKAADKPAARPQ